jgi:hypothetical protein
MLRSVGFLPRNVRHAGRSNLSLSACSLRPSCLAGGDCTACKCVNGGNCTTAGDCLCPTNVTGTMCQSSKSRDGACHGKAVQVETS